MKVGFIGLEIMGKPICHNQIKTGYELVVMDKNTEKDMNNVLETSHNLGIPLPLSATVMEMMQVLKSDGLGNEDHSGLIKYYEKIANLTLGDTLTCLKYPSLKKHACF